MAVDKIGSDTISGGWTIPHPLIFGVLADAYSDADGNARQMLKSSTLLGLSGASASETGRRA
jgi:hypothetical protein